MGQKRTKWLYITHYEFRKSFGLEEPKELVILRKNEDEGGFFRMTHTIDDTWKRLRNFVSCDTEYNIVPEKIICVFKRP